MGFFVRQGDSSFSLLVKLDRMMATGAPRRLMAPPACVARRLLSLAPRIEPGQPLPPPRPPPKPASAAAGAAKSAEPAVLSEWSAARTAPGAAGLKAHTGEREGTFWRGYSIFSALLAGGVGAAVVVYGPGDELGEEHVFSDARRAWRGFVDRFFSSALPPVDRAPAPLKP